jgi:phosphoribosylanthranilate isomerase
VQLHGKESAVYCEQLKLTGVEVIKAFGVDENFNFIKLEAYLIAVDYFLFDTQTAQHGGSGKIFDWSLLENYIYDVPFFLSGGIDLIHLSTIKNVIHPRLYAVDVNSKFELEPGLKAVEKLKIFFKEMNSLPLV